MDKRYQVFISSTYADLKEERRAVTQTVIELDCIPAGMELFPAADEEQMAFIKKVIDDCDYYLLIIGGRYGSVSETGVSYTEQEYDYAISHGLKVIALLHENPDEIPLGKSEKDPALREKLRAFRDKVATGRLVKFWKTASDLPSLVMLSLQKTIKLYPAVGWVRANLIASADVLSEINELRKQNAELQTRLADAAPKPVLPNLAGLDETTLMSGRYYLFNSAHDWKFETTWRNLFGWIAPYLAKHPYEEDEIRKALAGALAAASGLNRAADLRLDEQPFQLIGIQFMALDLVQISSKSVLGEPKPFWSLSAAGQRRLFEIVAVRAKLANPPENQR